jgi:hypothetical protein
MKRCWRNEVLARLQENNKQPTLGLGDCKLPGMYIFISGLSRAAFISGALRELSVALCRGNASLCRSGAYVATSAAGRAPMRGLAQPSAAVV